jgi:hypothetical protein
MSEESFVVSPGMDGRSDDQTGAAKMAGEASVYAHNWVNTSSRILFIHSC